MQSDLACTRILGMPIFHQDLEVHAPQMGICVNPDGNETAALWPAGAIAVTLLVCEQHAYVVLPAMNKMDSPVYFLSSEYSSVCETFPCNTTLHGLVFLDNNGNATIGLYDLTRLDNSNLMSVGILERHSRLHVMMAKNKSRNITVHWIGFFSACQKATQGQIKLPFEFRCICIIDKRGILLCDSYRNVDPRATTGYIE